MGSILKLAVGFSRNARIQPLIDGRVAPQDIELQFVLCSPGELFYRNLKYDEFDVSEMSISEYLMAREHSHRWNWQALPVFLSKAFLWLDLFVNAASGIICLGDFRGRRVGIPEYSQTAALWLRIFLKELGDVKPEQISWYNGRTREFSHARILGFDKCAPPGVSINWLSNGQSFDVMLDRGELDAAYGFLPNPDPHKTSFQSRYGKTPIHGNSRIRKLFSDGGQGVISKFYEKTGIIPSNHLVVVQKKLLDDNPWVALDLFKAFSRAKEVAYASVDSSPAAYLLFEGDDVQKQVARFGSDPYPLGVQANRKMLEMLLQNSYTDRLTTKLAKVEEIFCRGTLDT